MRTKIFAVFLTGGLLAGAGLVTSVISAPGTALAEEQHDRENQPHPIPRLVGFLGVLDGLVDDGTITQEQADAIVSAAEDEAANLKEQRPQFEDAPGRFRHLKGFRFGALLDDGGVDEEELEELRDNHPLKQVDVDEYLDDGLITPEELREILHGLREAPLVDSERPAP